MSKSEILREIESRLEHLQKRSDPFEEIKADCEVIKRMVTELRKMDSAKAKSIEDLTAELKTKEQKLTDLDAQTKFYEKTFNETNQAIDKLMAAAKSSVEVAKKIMFFHDNFKMASLEKLLGEGSKSLSKIIMAGARDIHILLRKKTDPKRIRQIVFDQLDSLYRAASEREDKIYEACRKTLINFSIYLAAAVAKHGPIVVDGNTDLEPMEFAVDGEPPLKFTVRAKTEKEAAEDQAVEYRLKMQKITENVKDFAKACQGVRRR